MLDKILNIDTQDPKQVQDMLQYLYTKIKQLETENTALRAEVKDKTPDPKEPSSSFFNTQTYLQKSTRFTKPFKETQFSKQESPSVKVFLEQLEA
jgi:hypothetical protein